MALAWMGATTSLASVVRKPKRSFDVSPSFTLRTDVQRVQMPANTASGRIPGYFTKGETHVEVLFGAIAQNYSYYANQAVLNGAHYEPEFWTERQEKKIYRFEEILMRCGYEKNGNPDPSFGLKMYAETLDSFGYEPKELFSPFFRYFRDEEKRVMADLLIVKSETDYLEMLVDIADIVRSLEPNANPEEFRFNAYLISPPTMPDYMKQIVSKYPAFTYRHPVARAAREARSRNADPGAVNEAQRKVDDIEMVAEVLRDRAGLNPYSGLVRGVPRRDRNNVMPHNVMPYETKIAEKNGDVRQALWELRREEKDKPPAAPRGRRPPPNRQRVARRPNPRVAPAPMPESLPLTPRSRAELESIIADLEPPQLPNEDFDHRGRPTNLGRTWPNIDRKPRSVHIARAIYLSDITTEDRSTWT